VFWLSSAAGKTGPQKVMWLSDLSTNKTEACVNVWWCVITPVLCVLSFVDNTFVFSLQQKMENGTFTA